MSIPSCISTSFARKKARILQELSVPNAEYIDKSPKGSVDEAIRELIDEINAYGGLVTTSSCAGRISVFLEGHGQPDGDEEDREEKDNEEHGEREVPGIVTTARVPGGKGGGKFLFVSHEPVQVPEEDGMQGLVEKILGGRGAVINAAEEEEDRDAGTVPGLWRVDERVVRFAFEPMILHVMTASLHHAKPLLSAAIGSGFRESGVQSLKNLDDPAACPMLAVRTAGLGLEAIVASTSGRTTRPNRTTSSEDGSICFRQLVSRDYIAMLLKMCNQRFIANQARIERFRVLLRETMALEMKRAQREEEWESPQARRERKRAEGLRIQEAQRGSASCGKALH